MPQAIPFIVLAATVAGAGVAAYSSIEQGKAADEAGKYNQKVASNNAEAARQQAMFEADKVRKRNMLILGRQHAEAAKSGILDTGSMEDVFNDSAVQGELDAMVTNYGGAYKANYYASQGRLARYEGSAAQQASYYRAGGTLLTGAAQAGGYANKQWGNSGPTFED